MTKPVNSFIFNETTNIIYPVSTSTWSGLSGTSWDSWKEWAYSTSDQLVYWMPLLIIDKPGYFTLTLDTVADGAVSYYIYTSMTGEFNGEETETETIVEPGDTGIASFFGANAIVAVIVNRTTDMPKIYSIQYEIGSAGTREIAFNKVNTANLAGTQTARVLDLGTTVSTLTDVRITPYETASPYNLDVYVTNTATSTYLIPKVISSNTTSLTIALVGVDNHPRDGLVDVVVRALPEQYMDGNSLRTRS